MKTLFMKIFVAMLASMLIIGFAGCSSDSSGTTATSDGTTSTSDDTTISAVVPASADGGASKGPFKEGSLVVAYKLDSGVRTIDTNATTQTTDGRGHFDFGTSVTWTGPTEFVISGEYLNENTGTYMVLAPENGLRAVVNMVEGVTETININIFTDIATPAIKAALANSTPIEEATADAQESIAELFNLDLSEGVELIDLDLTDATENVEANTQLLLISAALLSTDNPEQVLEQLAEDMIDGGVDDSALAALDELKEEVALVDLQAVATTMEEADIGVTDAPDAASALDGTLAFDHTMSFEDKVDALREREYESNVITVDGIYGETGAISIVNGTYSIAGGAYVSSAGTVSNGQVVSVKATSSADFSTPIEAKLTIGGGVITYKVITGSDPVVDDTTPDDFSFGFVRDQIAGTTDVVSEGIIITGINIPTEITIDSGSFTVAGVLNAPFVNNGEAVIVTNDAGALGTQVDSIVTIGGKEGKFSIFTQAEDSTPDLFSFDDVNDVNTTATPTVESNEITITGINTNVDISIVDGEYSLDGGAFTSDAGTVAVNATIIVKQIPSSEYATAKTTTLTVGNAVSTFTTRTISIVEDTTPNEFSFATKLNQLPAIPVVSESITVSGINVATEISVEGGEYEINGGGYTSVAGTVSVEDTVTIRQTTSADYDTETVTTLTIGGVSSTFKTRTWLEDTTPTDFSFDSNLSVATDITVTSNSVIITGINTIIPISIENGTYSIGAAFTADNGTVSDGMMLTIRQISASTEGTSNVTTVTIGSMVRSFTTKTVVDPPIISGDPATTVAEDSPYSFAPDTNATSGEIDIWSIANKPSWANFDTEYGVLSGVPRNDDVGITADINITAINAQGISSILFDVNVTNTNDAPVIDSIADVVIDEDYGTTTVPTVVTDVDISDSLIYTVVSSNPAIADVSVSNTDIIVTSGANIYGSVTVTLTIDDGTVSVDETFTFTVNPVNDLPVIEAIADVVVDEDSGVATVETNVTDIDSTPTLSVTSSDVEKATVVMNGTSINITPQPDAFGDVTITLSAEDGTGTPTETFVFSITAVNDATVWNTAGTLPAVYEDFAEFSIELDATDVDGPVTYAFVSTNGIVTASVTDSTLTISAIADLNGAEIIVVSATEGGVTVNHSITLTVNAVNDAPVAGTFTPLTEIDEDSYYEFDSSATDVEGNEGVSYILENNPPWMSIVGSGMAAGRVSGTPTNADVNTTTSIIIKATDGELTTVIADFSVTVTNTNDVPVAQNDAIDVIKNIPYNGVLPASDEDVGDVLTYSIDSTSMTGSVIVTDVATGAYTYTPEVDATYTTSFTFTVADKAGTESTGTISVTVSEPNVTIVTTDDNIDAPEDSIVEVDVLANDESTNEETGATTFGTNFGTYISFVTDGSNGTTSIVGDIVLYVPNQDWHGTDTFTYRATTVNGNESVDTTVTVTIYPVNDTTEWQMEGAFADLDEDFASFSVELNATDVDGPVTYGFVSTDGLVTAEVAGSTLTITPILDAHGDTTITVSASEGGESVNHTFTLTLTPVNDPTIWNTPASQPAVDEDFEEFTIELNATDVDGPVSYALNGAASGVEATVSGSTLTIISLGDVNGVASISVMAIEDSVETNLDITFDINLVNDAPVIAAEDVVVVEDSGETVVSISITDVDFSLTSDNVQMFSIDDSIATVIDGNETSVTILAQDDANGDVTITIRAVDEEFTVEETFMFTITPVDDAPTIDSVDDRTISLTGDHSISLSITDIDGTGILVSSSDGNASSATSVVSGTTLTITPVAVGSSIITIRAAKDTNASAFTEETFTVTVSEANQAPTADDSFMTLQSGKTTYGSLNVSDPENDALTFIIDTAPSNGTAEIINGVLKYTANTDYEGSDSVDYTVDDGEFTASATVYITVQPLLLRDILESEVFLDTAGFDDLTAQTFIEDTMLYEIDIRWNDGNISVEPESFEFNSSDSKVYWYESDENGTATYSMSGNIAVIQDDFSNDLEEVKYLGAVTAATIADELSITVPSSAAGYRMAWLRVADEYDFWDEVVRQWDEDTSSEITFSSLEDFIVNGQYVNWGNDGTALVFAEGQVSTDVSGNIVQVVNDTQAIVVADAGTWDIVSTASDGDVLVIRPTVDGFSEEGCLRAYKYDSTPDAVVYGELCQADYGGTFTAYNDVAQAVILNAFKIADPDAFDTYIDETNGAEFSGFDGLTALSLIKGEDLYGIDSWVDSNGIVTVNEWVDNFELNGSFSMTEDGVTEWLLYDEDAGVGIATIGDGTTDMYQFKFIEELDYLALNIRFPFASFGSGAIAYKTAYLHLTDEYEYWDNARAFSTIGDPDTTDYVSLEAFIADAQFVNNKAFEGRTDFALAFSDGSTGLSGTLSEKDWTNGIVSDAGTWEIVGDVLYIYPINEEYNSDRIYSLDGGSVVRQGEFMRADTGGIEYKFNLEARDALVQGINFYNIAFNAEIPLNREGLTATISPEDIDPMYWYGAYREYNHITISEVDEFLYSGDADSGILTINFSENGVLQDTETLDYIIDTSLTAVMSLAGDDVHKLKVLQEINAIALEAMSGIEMPESAKAYEVAHIRLIDEFDFWGEEAQDVDGNPFSDLEALVTTAQGTNGFAISHNAGHALQFDSGDAYSNGFGGVFEVDIDDSDNTDSTDIYHFVGTWRVVQDDTLADVIVLSIDDTYGSYNDDNAFKDVANVEIGEYEEAYTGEITYQFNSAAKEILDAYFQNSRDIRMGFTQAELSGNTFYTVRTDGGYIYAAKVVFISDIEREYYTYDSSTGDYTYSNTVPYDVNTQGVLHVEFQVPGGELYIHVLNREEDKITTQAFGGTTPLDTRWYFTDEQKAIDFYNSLQ